MDLTIRFALPADAAALHDLAALDSAPRTPAGEVLVAESGGALVAALSLDDGRVVADPFRPTADVVALLRVRAGQARPSTSASAASAARSISAWTSLRGWRHLPRT
jgi:hypothetical protein